MNAARQSLVSRTVAERFVVESFAGSGGMGAVYRAHDRTSGARVALKVLRSGMGDESRFAREAVTLSKLEHPGVVRYLDHGFTDDHEPYLVMEWLEGEDLARRLERGPLALPEVLLLARKLAGTLAALHDLGIVHRDIKPANLFLEHGGIEGLKLLDFGIARMERVEASLTATKTGLVMGTPSYMAPEQARGDRNVDARADLFAAGCVLFECLAGRPPFLGETPLAVLAKIVFEPTPRLDKLRPDAPAPLVALIGRLLAKDPAERLASGRALLAAIDGLERDDLQAAPGSTAAVSLAELRVVSVVLAAALAGGEPTLGDGESPPPGQISAVRQAGTIGTASGARIARLAGGSMLATFTSGGSPKDQAERAGAVALEWNRLIGPRAIAVATGRAAVAGNLPLGEVIDRAARLAQGGADGETCLDETSAALLEPTFEIVLREQRRVLVGPRGADLAMRELLGRPVPCVGRERELGLLASVLDECAGEPLARAALVVAPAGTGKSRLVHEMVRATRMRIPEARIALVRLDALGAGSPFGLASRVVRQITEMAPVLPPAQRHRAIVADLAKRKVTGDAARKAAAFLAELVGGEAPEIEPELAAAKRDPALMAEGILGAWITWMEAVVRRDPLLVVIEDLHWGDLPSARLFDALLDRLHERPICVVATARPEVEAVFPSLWADRGIQEIRLGTLNRRASARLVRGALPDLADEDVESIVKRAAGHPFYLEELVRAVGAGAAPEVLPDSVLGMLQTRLDALGDDAKRVLRAASVLGERFWEEGVRALVAEPYGVGALLEQLVSREVVERQPADDDVRGGCFAFRHAIVRDAAYATLPDAERAHAHALAGHWLERVGEGDVLLLADHFARGGVADRACGYLLGAAQAALDGGDPAGSLAAVERARSLGPEGETAGRLEHVAAEAVYSQGDPVKAAQIAERAVEVLVEGTSQWFRAAGLRVLAAGQSGDNETVYALAMRGGAVRRASGTLEDWIWLVCRAASQLFYFDSARAREVMGLLDRETIDVEKIDGRVAGILLRARAEEHLRGENDFTGTVELFDRSAAAFRRAGATRDAGFVTVLGGAFAGFAGEPEAGLRRMKSVLDELGWDTPIYVVRFARMEVGLMNVFLGNYAEARAAVEPIVDGLAGSPRLQCHALQTLAIVAQAEGHHERALALTERALAMGLHEQLHQLLLTLRASILVDLGRLDDAKADVEAIQRISLTREPLREMAGYTELSIGRVALARGDRERAAVFMQKALEEIRVFARRIVRNEQRAAYFAMKHPNAEIVRYARELGLDVEGILARER